jgi:hypothetical protein
VVKKKKIKYFIYLKKFIFNYIYSNVDI